MDSSLVSFISQNSVFSASSSNSRRGFSLPAERMLGSTLVAPSYAHLGIDMVEQIRSNHEEIEKLEQLVMAELKREEPTRMKQVLQGHRLRSIINSIILKTEKLVEMYENKDVDIKDEITQLPDHTNVSSAFVSRLKKIVEYHRNHPSVSLVIADDDYESLLKEKEPVIMFSGEESFGRYLDLHDMYNQYVSSNFGERVEYSAYLDVFSQPEKIPSQLKLSRQYTEYLEALLEYLIYFFQRTEPLQDLDRIFSKVETDFEEQYTQGKVENETVTEQARLGNELSLMEVKMKKLCNLLDEAIKRTKEKGEKKKALAFEEMEKEESKSGVMGWDGMPKPYWPYKLGQEYKCEICRTCYWGKRCYQRHFEEGRHKGGLGRLDIQGTEKFNEEAKEVWERMKPKIQNEETEEHNNSSEAPAGVAIPPGEIKTMLVSSALFLSKQDLEVEERIVGIYGEHASFKFLKSSDPYHAFYQYKLNEYRALNRDIDSDAERSGYGDSLPADGFMVPPPTLETDKFTCRLPEGITAKEVDIIKLTAQFWARFGRGFEKRVKKDPEFEFMKPSDGRFSLFVGLVRAYSSVLRPPFLLKEKLREKSADIETVVENCLHRLHWDGFLKKRREERATREKKRPKMVRLNESLSLVQAVHLSEMMRSARRPPHPITATLEESDLVPENEFLAQHRGWGTIRISIPHANDAYIEITVPSLLETVASLKERIALQMPLPASNQKLSGKTGVLKDDMSLAFYNLGPRDFLTLSKIV